MEINIAQLLSERYPHWAKILPAFALHSLQRLLHEHEINEILAHYGGLSPAAFLQSTLHHLDIDYSVDFSPRITRDGRYIFVSNHPFGGIDGMILADMLIRRFGDVRVVVNHMLSLIEPLAPLWIPVQPNSRQKAEVARHFDHELMGDRPIATFPAGLCSRLTNGKVTDPAWKPTFVRKAYASQRAIVPVYFEGQLSNNFYRIALLRKTLGIKANIESILLVDELFRRRGCSLRIVVGDPIFPSELQQHGVVFEQCNYVREQTYSLASKLSIYG